MKYVFFSVQIFHIISLWVLSKEERANQWWLWRMMDVPTANQSQTPCHTWVGQEGWDPPSCTQLPSFQHLTLSSASDQRPCYGHHQASVQGTLQVNNPQQNTRDPHMLSIANTEQCRPHFFCHTHTHQMLQNAAYSPNEEHMHIVSRVPGPDAYQNPACSPEPALGLGNVKSSDGFLQCPASPTSPLHQPPDGVSSHYIGLFIRIIQLKQTNKQDANQDQCVCFFTVCFEVCSPQI